MPDESLRCHQGARLKSRVRATSAALFKSGIRDNPPIPDDGRLSKDCRSSTLQIDALHRLVVFGFKLAIEGNVLVNGKRFPSRMSGDELQLSIC